MVNSSNAKCSGVNETGSTPVLEMLIVLLILIEIAGAIWAK